MSAATGASGRGQKPAPGAPWFYRKRFAVFGMIYGCSFFLGFAITGIAGLSPVPVYRALGNPVAFGIVATLLVLAGVALRVWASSYLSAAVMWSEGPVAVQLRVSGPYRFTRNPLYLGNVLQALGIAMVTPWLVCALILAGIVLFDYALILVEERFLAARQGEAYASYLATVGRLFPKLWKIAPDGGQQASLRDGLRAETSIGFFAVAAFAIALGLSILNGPR